MRYSEVSKMTKAEIHDYTKNARYWLGVIDRVVRKPGGLELLSETDQSRLLYAAREASGNAGMLETLFTNAEFAEDQR